jgi:hypothetical protein
MGRRLIEDPGEATLCEALDRILHRGAVVSGDVVITVANIELIYLNLKVFLSSVDKAMEVGAFLSPQRGDEQR